MLCSVFGTSDLCKIGRIISSQKIFWKLIYVAGNQETFKNVSPCPSACAPRLKVYRRMPLAFSTTIQVFPDCQPLIFTGTIIVQLYPHVHIMKTHLQQPMSVWISWDRHMNWEFSISFCKEPPLLLVIEMEDNRKKRRTRNRKGLSACFVL